MKISLQSRATIFVAAVVVAASAASALFFINAHKKSMEREIIVRGITLAESLSRAIHEGVASENLDFIKQVEEVVHTQDVALTQVYSSLWHAIDSYPIEKQNEPPDPSAMAFYKSNKDHFYKKEDGHIDFYSPIYYEHQTHLPVQSRLVIGYVRVKLSMYEFEQALKKQVLLNILISVICASFSILLLNFLLKKYILKPVLALYSSATLHKQGELPETVPVHSHDELGQLTEEFNSMITALREREERIGNEKERLLVTLRSIGDAVIVTDTGGTVTLMNRVAERMTGWDSSVAEGRPINDVFNIVNEKTGERCENPVEKVIKKGVIVALENHTALISKTGERRIIEDSAAPIRDSHSVIVGVVLVFRDVTEKIKMEAELTKIVKLESVGVLAGGIAHDFNNLLTAIIGNISLAQFSIGEESKAYARLANAVDACKRAADLTQQLLTFSKGGAPLRETGSITNIIRESAKFILSGTNIAPAFDIPDDLWNVDIDAGQISQVFNNLIINAVQAMPDGGRIFFSATNTIAELPVLREGPYIKVSVRDTGAGIPQNMLPNIFDPYFTTKDTGSGLGLATVYSIIKRHDGYITVESKEGDGTVFHIYLHAVPGKSLLPKERQEKMDTGSGIILVMDDEEAIRDVAGEMLASLGYKCMFASNGNDAVKIYGKMQLSATPIDLVIMDLTIPGGMGGDKAIANILEINPEAKVIVSSGYSNSPIMANYAQYGFSGCIVKPYTAQNFSSVINNVLSSRRFNEP
ncbi:MAG: response regulator [Nitrospirae bacterium]|nr:MAG: response regulator [Nitrospirota bacterium]